MKYVLASVCGLFIFSALLCVSKVYALPAGWDSGGNALESFTVKVEPADSKGGEKVLSIESKTARAGENATVSQTILAEKYHGARVEFSADVKTEAVTSAAELWISIYDETGRLLMLHNMAERPIKGATAWGHYRLPIDVPSAGKKITFGVVLAGTGTMLVKNLAFDTIQKTEPLTGIFIPARNPSTPVNLALEVNIRNPQALPEGWSLAGKYPGDYSVVADSNNARGEFEVVRMESKSILPDANFVLKQVIDAANYKGSRIKLSGYIKTKELDGWGGLWLSAKDLYGRQQYYTNSESDTVPLAGTVPWQKVEIMADIPADSDTIQFGGILFGKGALWLGELNFQDMIPEVPANLELE